MKCQLLTDFMHLGIKTCGDIYEYRAYLSRLFGEKAFQFLMTCYLGLGRTKVQPAEEFERKSVGTESTFHDMSSKTELREKLRHIAEELEKDTKRTQFKGRTLVLKIKLHTYEVLTRQVAPPKAVHLADDLYKFSLPMLSKLEKEIPGLTLRLMGLRLTHLVSMKKETTDFFGASQSASTSMAAAIRFANNLEEEWEVWPESEFEDAARQEKQDEMDEVEALSQEHEETRYAHGQIRNASYAKSPGPATDDKTEVWACPVCSRPQVADDRAFNDHIDFCLSKGTIQDVAKEGTSGSSPQINSSWTPLASKKRGRSSTTGILSDEAAKQKKRLFFG